MTELGLKLGLPEGRAKFKVSSWRRGGERNSVSVMGLKHREKPQARVGDRELGLQGIVLEINLTRSAPLPHYTHPAAMWVAWTTRSSPGLNFSLLLSLASPSFWGDRRVPKVQKEMV